MQVSKGELRLLKLIRDWLNVTLFGYLFVMNYIYVGWWGVAAGSAMYLMGSVIFLLLWRRNGD